MRFSLFLIFILAFGAHLHAQQLDDIVLDLDSIKNIKTTRYSSINEIGTSVNVAGTMLQKFVANTKKTNLQADKPNVSFRTVHGALINPNFFVGGGVGLDFRPNGSVGTHYYYFTFPFFIELREYFLKGDFNLFLSERLGGAINIDSYFNKFFSKGGKSSGAFGEFMLGGRYVTAGKKIAIHFGVGYRMQHLQHKIDIQGNGGSGQPAMTYVNTPEITIKHYVPIMIGVTF